MQHLEILNFIKSQGISTEEELFDYILTTGLPFDSPVQVTETFNFFKENKLSTWCVLCPNCSKLCTSFSHTVQCTCGANFEVFLHKLLTEVNYVIVSRINNL